MVYVGQLNERGVGTSEVLRVPKVTGDDCRPELENYYDREPGDFSTTLLFWLGDRHVLTH